MSIYNGFQCDYQCSCVLDWALAVQVHSVQPEKNKIPHTFHASGNYEQRIPSYRAQIDQDAPHLDHKQTTSASLFHEHGSGVWIP